MSTELKTIETQTRLDHTAVEFEMVKTEVAMTAFGGGERGRCLQMSLAGVQRENYNTPYAHFTLDEAVALRDELTRFIEKNY